MNGPGGDRGPGDPIGEYLDQLRAGLRCSPQEAEVILTEAEDHLLQTVAAGVAIGMTEHEAQEAAISSFGSVQAVTHAHLARLTRSAGPVDLAMAAWKLISLLLLTGGAGAMASIVLVRPRQLGPPNFQVAAIIGLGSHVRSASFSLRPHHLAFNWLSGNWTEVGTWTQMDSGRPRPYYIVWNAQSVLGWHNVTLVTAAGAVLLAGYLLARWGLRHRGAPLAGFFPFVAVGFFGVVAVTLLGLRLSSVAPAYDPAFVTAAFGVLFAGYAARMGQTLLRQRD